MKKPLMLTPEPIPPAQAEALYDLALSAQHTDERARPAAAPHPYDEWEDEVLADPSSPPLRTHPRSRIAPRPD